MLVVGEPTSNANHAACSRAIQGVRQSSDSQIDVVHGKGGRKEDEGPRQALILTLSCQPPQKAAVMANHLLAHLVVARQPQGLIRCCLGFL